MPQRAFAETTARDLMITKLHTLRPEQEVYAAVQMLLAYKITGAPVVDPGGRFLGVLTERDCLDAILRGAYEGLPTPLVGAAMSTDVMTIGPDVGLLAIAGLFRTGKLRRLPVIEDGRLIGQVGRSDLLQHLSQILKPQLSYQATPLYLSALEDSDVKKLS